MNGRLRSEAGYSLIEMLTVLVIMSVIMTGLTTLFVQGSNAELDINLRFQAQQEARVGLDRLRRELHCSSSATAASATAVTLANPCISGGLVSWCTRTVSSRVGLYRQLGTTATCSTGIRYVDYLTSTNVFWYDAQSTASLAKLHVNLSVNAKPIRSVDTYALCDTIVLRNSQRIGSAVATVPSTPTPPC